MAKNFGISALRFPVGGLVKRYGFQSQPPYTTPDCLNVRPFDTLLGRERGGSRPCLAKKFDSRVNGAESIQLLATVSVVSHAGAIENRLVAIAGGACYHDSSGALYASSGLSVNDEVPLMATQLGQKLYIADRKTERVFGVDGIISDSNHLSAPSITNWNALDIDIAKDKVFVGVILGDDGEPEGVTAEEANTYAITSIDAGGQYLVVDHAFETQGACSYEVGRPVKVFDPDTNTVAELEATYGIVPLNCPIISTFRNRLVLAGPENLWYMSRAGDPTDWDYGASPDDATKAVAGPESGASVQAPIRAVVPHSDDYLLFFCENSTWLLRGDPAFGGQIDAVSREIGIVGPTAYCYIPDGSVLVLSRDGLYLFAAGSGTPPVSFSRERLPASLLDVDAETNPVVMSYDVEGRGVHLLIGDETLYSPSSWWIDWTEKSFWPVAFPNSMVVTAVLPYAADSAGQRQVLLGCRDGYVRFFDPSASDDDGEVLASAIVYGPIPIAPEGFVGVLLEIAAELDLNAANVDWYVGVGNTAYESVYPFSYPLYGTWTYGINARSFPHTRGMWAAIRLQSNGRWAVEQLRVRSRPGGRIR